MTVTDNVMGAQLDFPYVTIGVLTALEEEYAACLGIFDPDKRGVERQRDATSGTLNCRLCSIPSIHGGEHVVAITRLPAMGNTAAAIAANILMQHCNGLKSLIMCGIAGAVPHPEKAENHVRLGDIVVTSQHGIIQYDFGKQRDPTRNKDDPFNGFEFRPPPRPPCPTLLAAVGRMRSDERFLGRAVPREWEKKIDLFLDRFRSAPAWKRPSQDKLIDSPDGMGPVVEHPKDPERRRTRPRVFLGSIGAANIVLADPTKRNALRDRWNIRAVEMEGSGIADAGWVANVGYLVIRGTCDYCNSAKNDKWHSYAAVIAAAYTHTVIEHLHPPHHVRPGNLAPLQVVPPHAPHYPPDTPMSALRTSAPSLSADPPQSSAAGMRDPKPLKQEVSPSVALNATGQTRIAPPPDTELLRAVAPAFQFAAIEHQRIHELTQIIESLSQTGRWNDTHSVAHELERLLESVPRQGNVVRDGWLALAAIETTQLRIQKRSGGTIDASRLQRLREEAKRVTN